MSKYRSPLILILSIFMAFCLFAFIALFLDRGATARPLEGAAKTIQEASAVKAPRPAVSVLQGALEFHDVEKQSREFMGYYHSIALTPEQEAIKAEVLEAMPAACCSRASAYTCCCPCNLSKTLWGLSNFVIAEKGVNAVQLKEVVDSWLAFTNGNGYSGDACYRGGCERGFQHDGCGGMHESNLSV